MRNWIEGRYFFCHFKDEFFFVGPTGETRNTSNFIIILNFFKSENTSSSPIANFDNKKFAFLLNSRKIWLKWSSKKLFWINIILLFHQNSWATYKFNLCCAHSMTTLVSPTTCKWRILLEEAKYNNPHKVMSSVLICVHVPPQL